LSFSLSLPSLLPSLPPTSDVVLEAFWEFAVVLVPDLPSSRRMIFRAGSSTGGVLVPFAGSTICETGGGLEMLDADLAG
jgi:hypothetical protein